MAAVLLDIRINERDETWKCDALQEALRELALPCLTLHYCLWAYTMWRDEDMAKPPIWLILYQMNICNLCRKDSNFFSKSV